MKSELGEYAGSLSGTRRWSPARIVLPVVAVGGAALGFWGFYSSMPLKPELERIVLSLLGAVQLFVLGVDVDKLANWPMRLGALVSPAATATALWAVFAEEVGAWWFRIRTSFEPPDTVLVGGGYLASVILSRLQSATSAARQSVVVLDIRQNPSLRKHSSTGVRVAFRVGDGLDPAALAAVGALRAKRVWIATGSDQQNIRILQLLCAQSQMQQAQRSIQISASRDWLVDISKRDLLRYAAGLEDRERARMGAPPRDTKFFNIERMVAREVLRFMMSDPKGPGDHVWRSRVQSRGFHVAIVGGGDLAEEIVLHAIQYLIVDESVAARLAVTWFGGDLDGRRARLSKGYPVLDSRQLEVPQLASLLPLADLRIVDCDELHLPSGDWRAAQLDQQFSIVIVVPDDERTQELLLGQVVAQSTFLDEAEGSAPVIFVLPPSMKSVHTESSREGVYFFDAIGHVWQDGESYPGEHCDIGARRLNLKYAQGSNPGIKVDEAWAASKEFERWSSRYGADHRDIQMRLRSTLDPAADPVDALARVEHRRFVVERLMDGWLPIVSTLNSAEALGSSRLERIQLHPDLVPWEQLTTAAKDKTREHIRRFVLGGEGE